jgi:hypothetical protein
VPRAVATCLQAARAALAMLDAAAVMLASPRRREVVETRNLDNKEVKGLEAAGGGNSAVGPAPLGRKPLAIQPSTHRTPGSLGDEAARSAG